MPALDFPACSKNKLDVALYKNFHAHAEKVEAVEKIYNFSEDTPIRLKIEVPYTENKPPLETFRNFGNANLIKCAKMRRNKPLISVYALQILAK